MSTLPRYMSTNVVWPGRFTPKVADRKRWISASSSSQSCLPSEARRVSVSRLVKGELLSDEAIAQRAMLLGGGASLALTAPLFVALVLIPLGFVVVFSSSWSVEAAGA